jgi:hypothetical protein
MVMHPNVRISQVLRIQFKPDQDFLFIMRSGDLLCRLACALYQNVDCHLLEKGLEYGVHKVIFFLELCKSLHIKRSLLFQLSDILVWPDHDPHRKHALIVLRTIIALEKHARKSGWNGPPIQLKQQASFHLGVSSRDSVIQKGSADMKKVRKGSEDSLVDGRRPSIPINFNPPPPPIDPPTQFVPPSRSSPPMVAYQRRNSQDKVNDYQPRRKASKSVEFEPINETTQFEQPVTFRGSQEQLRKASAEKLAYIAPRQDSLKNLESSSKEELVKEVRFAHDPVVANGFHHEPPARLDPSARKHQVAMIPQATQVQGHNYADSSDDDDASLSDQISEISEMLKDSMSRNVPKEPVVDHKQMLQEAIRQRIALRSSTIKEFVDEEVFFL